MAISVIVEQATHASGARFAGLIAQAAEQHDLVRLIVRDSGPLYSWFSEHLSGQITICNRGNFPFEAPFSERVSAAMSIIEGDSSDIAYVYGTGASDFAVAAKCEGRRVVVHAPENVAQLQQLLARDQMKKDCGLLYDALVSSENCGNLAPLLGRLPERVIEIGQRIDLEWLTSLAAGSPAEALNASGSSLSWGERFLVGGGGSAEDGDDVFLSLAGSFPEIDFVWIDGGNTGSNRDRGETLVRRHPNVYATGKLENAFPSLAALSAYFVCGIEAETSIAPLAAAALRLPVVGFSKTSAAGFLGRHGILVYGDPKPAGAEGLLAAMVTAPASAGCSLAHVQRGLDIAGAVDAVLRLMMEIRLR